MLQSICCNKKIGWLHYQNIDTVTFTLSIIACLLFFYCRHHQKSNHFVNLPRSRFTSLAWVQQVGHAMSTSGSGHASENNENDGVVDSEEIRTEIHGAVSSSVRPSGLSPLHPLSRGLASAASSHIAMSASSDNVHRATSPSARMVWRSAVNCLFLCVLMVFE